MDRGPTLSDRVQRLEQSMRITSEDDYIRTAAREDTLKSAQQEFNHQKTPDHAPTVFEEIIDRIQGCNDRVCVTAGKLEVISDRIMGTLQTTGESTSGAIDPKRPPDGTLDRTFMALGWLDDSLSRLECVTLRLDRI